MLVESVYAKRWIQKQGMGEFRTHIPELYKYSIRTYSFCFCFPLVCYQVHVYISIIVDSHM